MLILRFGPNGEKYFDGDLIALQTYPNLLTPSKTNSTLDLRLYPEPYAGNPYAKVYILSGNPGLDNQDYALMLSNGANWDTMMENSYYPIQNIAMGNKPTPTLYWLDPKWDKIIQPFNGHKGGFDYWNKKTKDLRNALAKRGIHNLHDKLFDIEYFPYHSSGLDINDALPSLQYLQSMKEVDDILRRALDQNDPLYDQNRLFLILRCEKQWKARLAYIANSLYNPLLMNNVISLNSSRNVCITLKNVGGQPNWNRLLNALSQPVPMPQNSATGQQNPTTGQRNPANGQQIPKMTNKI